MASQISPGVVVKERDLTTGQVVGSQAIQAAFVSTFQKGPVGDIINISSERELVDTFGYPGASNAEDFFVASEFLSYGGRLSVVRAETGAVNAGAAAIIRSKEDYESRIESTTPSWKFAARSPGIWGNNLEVVVADRGADQYVTFASTPAAMAAGTNLTFSGGKTAEVLSWNAASRRAAVILDVPTNRLTATDTLDTPDTGVATGFTPVTGNLGTGYTTATNLEVTGGNGSGARADIVVNVGTVNTVTLGQGGSTYVAGTDIATTGGTGSNLTVDITVSGGVIQTITINNAGTGYTVNDAITVSTGGNNATFTVDSVRGAITSASVNAGGTLYEAGDVLTVVQSGGAGGQLSVAGVQDTSIALTVEDWWTKTTIDGEYSSDGEDVVMLSSIGPRPGTSAFASQRSLEYDEVHIAVVDRDGDVGGDGDGKATILERLLYLSKLSDGKTAEGASAYYRTLVKEVSEYVFAGAHPSALHNPSSAGAGLAVGSAGAAQTSAAKMQLFGADAYLLTGGTDDYAYTPAEFKTGLDEFNDKETVSLDFVLMGGSMASETDTKLKAGHVMSLASRRKDCIAFVSAHKGNQVSGTTLLSRTQQKDNTVNFFANLGSNSYAVFDSGYKYYYDRFNDTYRYIPCNGDVAGLCVSTTAILDDWFSPAGFSRGGLRNAIKLAYNPTQSDRDELYGARINPIVSFPGQGITLFGDKTALSSPSAFDRINVRRLFLNIEKRAEALAKGVIFEQNDETTRLGFTSAISSYLAEVQARRGITDYLVVCDSTNNTPEVIDRNEFVAEIYVKPTRSINYITLSFVATRSGVSFSEVVGRS